MSSFRGVAPNPIKSVVVLNWCGEVFPEIARGETDTDSPEPSFGGANDKADL